MIVETSSCFATFACCFVTPLTPVRSIFLTSMTPVFVYLSGWARVTLPFPPVLSAAAHSFVWSFLYCCAMHFICCGVMPPSWAPATVAVPAVTSEMAKNEAMRRRVSRTENPPWVGGSERS